MIHLKKRGFQHGKLKSHDVLGVIESCNSITKFRYRGVFEQHAYTRFECKTSDHRPGNIKGLLLIVGASFTATIKAIRKPDYYLVEDQLEKTQRAHFDQETLQRKMNWMSSCFKVSREDAFQVLKDRDMRQAILDILGK